MENQSKYDPTRKTVGAIYRDAQLHGDKTPITIGDMTAELKSSLVEDLNDELRDLPKDEKYPFFENRPYYVIVHESKDMAMPNCIKRRVIRKLYRPWPEDDTLVFWRNRDRSEIRFCWELPHWTQMDNILSSQELWQYNEWERKYVSLLKAWKNLDLYHFGFMKNEIGNWVPNPHWQDELLGKASDHVKIINPF